MALSIKVVDSLFSLRPFFRKDSVMSDVQIKPVETRRQQRAFIQLAWDLYRNDPNWIPPLRQNLKELLGFVRHPFHEFADMKTFLAYRGDRICGRIAAIVNHAHNEKYDERRGFFGFFECEQDEEVSQALFATAKEWLESQGMESMRGPVNPSLNYEIGLLIDGFDSPPTFMMTYNHPYYEQLFESFGFVKTQDLYAFWGHVDMMDHLDKKLEFVVEEATRRFDVKMRRLDRRRFKEELQSFLNIYNKSLVGTWGFVPLSDGEIAHFGGSLKHLIAPEMTTFAEIDGKPVAVVFGLLDYNPRIKAIDGRLFPFGFVKLLWNRRAITKVRVISANVLPEYQTWGLGLVTLSRLGPEILDWGVKEVEFSWVLESNHLSYRTLERGGAKLIKTYRIYDLAPESNNQN